MATRAPPTKEFTAGELLDYLTKNPGAFKILTNPKAKQDAASNMEYFITELTYEGTRYTNIEIKADGLQIKGMESYETAMANKKRQSAKDASSKTQTTQFTSDAEVKKLCLKGFNDPNTDFGKLMTLLDKLLADNIAIMKETCRAKIELIKHKKGSVPAELEKYIKDDPYYKSVADGTQIDARMLPKELTESRQCINPRHLEKKVKFNIVSVYPDHVIEKAGQPMEKPTIRLDVEFNKFHPKSPFYPDETKSFITNADKPCPMVVKRGGDNYPLPESARVNKASLEAFKKEHPDENIKVYNGFEPAKVNIDGTSQPLNLKNVEKFITPDSAIVSGIVTINGAQVSTALFAMPILLRKAAIKSNPLGNRVLSEEEANEFIPIDDTKLFEGDENPVA